LGNAHRLGSVDIPEVWQNPVLFNRITLFNIDSFPLSAHSLTVFARSLPFVLSFFVHVIFLRPENLKASKGKFLKRT